jgi:hypothetical protein
MGIVSAPPVLKHFTAVLEPLPSRQQNLADSALCETASA